jgi:hypothetical protein
MDDSFWEEIERFKNVPGGRKITAGFELFDSAMSRMLAGIKMQFPGVSEAEARRIRRERLDKIRQLEDIP